ncbi:uncharacterized protein N7498_003570 [Penicillium cinerascens]|uniref:AT DNA binding protein n=1 Tax=Penicillium cinerascens TaxID=70096 RepID=A0A9W9T795_9EURO|nr:uncharacterized protein N7498_003570 [Penicillium cinerascens]KAJ5211924.1 hypothetical protein N7498_003570 [Penicillium cinerascens]
MSSTSRSQSSSPDILGPPGDAEYLISSPIKPFVGRQSWLSPANLRRQQTPAKRSRVSLSPAKSAHSIRFDDVLLPGSPKMKLHGRQRSFSPEKGEDGNVSPWRIRVTLEATQDEENENHGSPSRKRLRPSTTTTMVPLKDDRSPLQEKTPARRRGRPRKSDVQMPNGSPWPASAGNTPGPKGGSPQKGKRGRPRNGTPKPKAQEVPVAEEEPTPAPAISSGPDLHFSPMDIAVDGGADSPRQFTPMNLGTDGLDSDSLGADDLPVAFLRPPTPAVNRDRWGNDNAHESIDREYGRASYGTPVIGAAEHHYLDHDDNIHSTPSKMPSPTREKSVSSARSAHQADSTSPRTYPSPTPTSSLAEEEAQHEEPRVQQQPVDDDPPSEPDPTDEHEEFDSIMESEGFTMVSLDTLPSAKQYGLSSAKISTGDSSNRRDNGRIGDKLKRQLPGGIGGLQDDSHSSTRPSPVALAPSSALRPPSRARLESQNPIRKSPLTTVSYPELPAASPEKIWNPPDVEQEPPTHERQTAEDPAEDEEAENIDLGMDGDEGQVEEVEEIEEEDWDDDDEVQVVNPSPQFGKTHSPQPSPWGPRSIQREDEWHIERQAVSRQARDPTNVQRLITIQSDEEVSQGEMVSGKDTFDIHSQSDVESIVDEDPFDERPLEEELVEEDHVEEAPFKQSPLYDDEQVLEEEEVMEEDPFELKPFQEEPIEAEPVEEPPPENPRDLESVPMAERSRTANQATEAEPETYDEDDESVDIWQQEPENSEFDRQLQSHTTNQAVEIEQETMDDDDGGFDDIWQQEARDNSFLSKHSDDREQIPADDGYRAWRRIDAAYSNENSLSSSPAYVTMDDGNTKYLGPTHIRKLRDEDVDLSALLAQEDTPNHARYYNGTSTPRSILSRRSGPQPPSINGSSIKSASSRKAGQRVRLQPIFQSPERESEAQVSSPAMRHKLTSSEPQPDEVDETGSVSDSDLHETESIQAESVATPEQPQQPNADAPGSTWLQRITSLTPRWLKAPADAHDDSSSAASGNESQEEDDEDQEMDSIESAKEVQSVEEDDEDEEEDLFIEQGAPNQSAKRDAASLIDDDHHELSGPRPLAVFGYFSDDHYKALRRLYRMAKRDPERFPYYDAPGRAQIIGDWIWTSDGRHGVPITEVQFAIIDRFVHDLSRADVQYGGSGQVDWTEADLHRRLISIIIGEQIREERKAKVTRGVSVDTWR